MKRFGNLYSKIYDIDNLRKAHQNAKKGKGWYEEVKEVDANSEDYLKKLQKCLSTIPIRLLLTKNSSSGKTERNGNFQIALLPGSYLSMGDSASD